MKIHRIVEANCLFLFIQCILGQVSGDSHRDLAKLSRTFYSWRLEDSPEFATHLGVYKYNDKLDSFTLPQQDLRKGRVERFLKYLHLINTTDMDRSDWINYQILEDTLQTFLDGYKWRLYGGLNPMNFLEGNHIDPYVEVAATPFDTMGDFENFMVRLETKPQQLRDYELMFREAIRLKHTFHNVSVLRDYELMFREAIRLKHTFHNVSVIKVPEQIGRIVSRSVEHSTYYIPFDYVIYGIEAMDDAKRELVKERGVKAIQKVLDGYKRLKTFIEREYLPRTRPHWGVGVWPEGKDYYKACLKWHLSTDMSPEEVHRIGLSEVERISGRMQEILRQQGFAGSFVDFFVKLRTDPRFHNNTADQLLSVYRSIITDRIEPKLPELFKNIPNMPLMVEKMPNDGPGGQYIPGSEDGLRPGVFLVNLNRPNETATFMMMAITLHEANLGHHLQSSYAFKASLPDFRRNMEFSRYYQVPFHFPFYTAYVEGWALYAESLGEEVGLYNDEYELLGRYSSEIFRACRLVVDTGIHYYGWDREYAIQYMLNYTTFARNEMEIEVDRYITWPGQSCAYKIGEIKIKDLRKTAEEKLGDRFDIKEFHSVVLENGPMPLRILEDVVNNWIKNYSPPTDPCANHCTTPSVHFLSLCLVMFSLIKRTL
ncbi:uncharacterized protein LOC121376277 [Gigantopelta aegis]|uniref:uncharacterized protein LOC121376277 n=1 Tax=Gigantopelta aegis TaxID=1735272 RepID=UPI001B88A9F3|nr:uncharacterized protein LOC121376277 [Gigantopelta aegis]